MTSIHMTSAANALQIRPADLADPRVVELLAAHLAIMRTQSPPESVHALDLDQMRAPGLSLWAVWVAEELQAVGALKRLSPALGEIKSMHTRHGARRQGIAHALLEHILVIARAEGLLRLSLETGSQPAFAPARALYARRGFQECGPFADYRPDPNSVFMTLELRPTAATA
jgi:putative acetyltransferase